ncbi:ADP-ribosyl cyclase/cyclic ADP-ribose hydrolase [Citrus sinensis]|nr:ADP-ribosyl cyclase/cyclic ADP-ribose hydrolase [Citrus sinensis]
MASSSASCSSSSANINPQVKHDVFVSFRGEDTRDNFTSHLHADLCRKKIETFVDYQLKRGGEISTSLLDAIEGSKISIIIFSERYASSRWCLDELVKILDCKKKYGQIVIPVFYQEKFQRWRTALTEAANLSGFDSNVIGPESKLVEEISNEVLRCLDDTFQSENKSLVGVESCIKEIESLLGTREAEKTGMSAHLRQELLSTLLNDDGNVKIIPNIGLNFESKRLTRKKVLIVFDDVTDRKQIEFLIGELDSFASGSLIIITTRDKQVLINCWADKIYEVKELADADALKLFSRCAFRQDHPVACYMELTYKIIKYAQGVPLALKVLGLFLSARRKEEWESAITKLETVPHMEIQDVLKISYDGLDYVEQAMFLDIACYFVGANKDFVINYFDASDFFPEIGLGRLVDKSLITISCNKIRMHDLLQDMGRKIDREAAINNPGKCRRLWHHKDVNEGTEAIEGILLDMSKVNEIHLNSSTFKKMPRLRFLKFHGENKFKISHFEGEAFTELRYLYWDGYPSKSLPPVIRLDTLISLQLRESKVEQLWDGVPNLVNLKEIDLSYSRQLKKLPDLSQARNLENLLLKACSSLVETHSSIQYLSKLVTLDMRLCKNLNSLPSSLCELISLQRLYLSGCSNLRRIPESIINLSKLELLHLKNCSKLLSLPELPCNLLSVGVRRCTSLEALSSFSFLFSAMSPHNDQYFNLSDCLKLDQNELKGIAEDALQKIQQKATSWWMKLKEETDYKYKPSCGSIYFPGSEIPKWFRFSSMGSSIEFPQSDWINNEYLAIAFCAVVAFQDHHDEDVGFQLRCRIRFKIPSHDWYVRTIDYVESDHLFMGYYFFHGDKGDSRQDFEKALFKIYFYNHTGRAMRCCGVKKCGIRLLTAGDDFLGINLRSQQNFYSNEEEEPHPLKHVGFVY